MVAAGEEDMSRKSRRKERERRREWHLPPGLSPGTLIPDPDAPRPQIRVIAYGPDGITDRNLQDPEEVRSFVGRWPVTWINVDGLGDAAVIQKLGEIFELHRLALEDVINVHQRAKAESYGQYFFIVGRMAELKQRLEIDQLSLFLGRNYVLTFQEVPGDCFDSVRDRIRKGSGRLRVAGPDYLAYALLDAFIDHYCPLLEAYGERLEALEDDVVERPDANLMPQIHEVRRDLLAIRRAVWPLRDALSTLVREESPFITAETRIYLRDCYDHVIQVMDLLENYRDLASSLVEVYLTSVSNRMNEVMKVLTIIGTIFIPLTFLAGVYGMNFHYFPELNKPWGYPAFWSICVVLAVSMLIVFRRRGWL
jgi:magnesium transporter